MVYEISHTLGNQSEYVAANSPAEAIEKLKKEINLSFFFTLIYNIYRIESVYNEYVRYYN